MKTITATFEALPVDQQHLLWTLFNEQVFLDFLLSAIKQTEHMQNSLQAPLETDHESLLKFAATFREHGNAIGIFREFIDIQQHFQKWLREQDG